MILFNVFTLVFTLFSTFFSADISDEFKRVIEALHPHDDKIRIVLNKADMVDGQQLMRVYGALMWSLGKILATPEVARVYAGEQRKKNPWLLLSLLLYLPWEQGGEKRRECFAYWF